MKKKTLIATFLFAVIGSVLYWQYLNKFETQKGPTKRETASIRPTLKPTPKQQPIPDKGFKIAPKKQIKSPEIISKGMPLPPTRRLTGAFYNSYDVGSLQMMNEEDPKWKDKLHKELKRFQREDTKVKIKNIESLIEVTSKNTAKFVEVVEVSFFVSDGYRSSYNALVDSDSGKIIKIWNRSVPENRKKYSLTFKR
ncbi:MAG: hypothetical protein ISR65_09300 [Bacteriovoracaceae bacterium]|nr:hypothetical protein [Bacteriovoracaceae bacterium]